jgi:hypothetical protein
VPALHTPQRYKGYIYATAYARDVDGQKIITHSKETVEIDAGFEVAPGSDSDVEVTNAHGWASSDLVFENGWYAQTAISITQAQHKGAACLFLKSCSEIYVCSRYEV